MGIFDWLTGSKTKSLSDDEIMALWQKNVDNVNAAIADTGKLKGKNDRLQYKSPITCEEAAYYVAMKLKRGEIKSFYCLSQGPGYKFSADLSNCLNIDSSILNQTVDVIYSKIKVAIKVSIKNRQLSASNKKYDTIIGFTDNSEIADKWQILGVDWYACMSDEELANIWDSCSQKEKDRIIRYKFKHIKNFCEKSNFNRLTGSFVCNPFNGISGDTARDKAAYLVYNTIIDLKDKNITSFSNSWLDIFIYVNNEETAKEIVEILTNSNGLNFTVDTQCDIIYTAFRLRKEVRLDFMPLLKNGENGSWKSPEEMQEVRKNENLIPELCVAGISMWGAIKLADEERAKRSEQVMREIRESYSEPSYSDNYSSSNAAQTRAVNAQTNAIYSSQISAFEARIAAINARMGVLSLNSSEYAALKAERLKLQGEIRKLESMKKYD